MLKLEKFRNGIFISRLFPRTWGRIINEKGLPSGSFATNIAEFNHRTGYYIWPSLSLPTVKSKETV